MSTYSISITAKVPDKNGQPRMAALTLASETEWAAFEALHEIAKTTPTAILGLTIGTPNGSFEMKFDETGSCILEKGSFTIRRNPE
jgi:hypothetical protein